MLRGSLFLADTNSVPAATFSWRGAPLERRESVHSMNTFSSWSGREVATLDPAWSTLLGTFKPDAELMYSGEVSCGINRDNNNNIPPVATTANSMVAGATIFEELSEEQVAGMELADLERLCRHSGLDSRVAKQHRRRCKNRISAREASSKRRDEHGVMQTEFTLLRERLQDVAGENQRLNQENGLLRQELAVSCHRQQQMAAELERLNLLLAHVGVAN